MGDRACLGGMGESGTVWVHDLSPFLIEFGDGVGVRWYGLAYVAAFVVGYWMVRWFARRGYSELDPGRVGDFIAGVAFFGVLLGGRLGYMLFYDFGEFIRAPWILFRIWDGGMSSHGGILGIVVFTWFYARRHGLSWTGLGDDLVVVAPLGLFFGRMANFINGELYGRITSVPWGVRFPKELYGDADAERFNAAMREAILLRPEIFSPSQLVAAAYADESVRQAIAPFLAIRHPSQIYEALLEGLLLFAVLLAVRLRWRDLRHGILTGIFFIGYAVVRIFGELFRQPDASLVLGMTRGQFLSLFLIGLGIYFLVRRERRRTAEA